MEVLGLEVNFHAFFHRHLTMGRGILAFTRRDPLHRGAFCEMQGFHLLARQHQLVFTIDVLQMQGRRFVLLMSAGFFEQWNSFAFGSRLVPVADDPLASNKNPMPKSSKRTPAAPSQIPTTRFVCVHGHFYQPPRENPWLETVEVQESAAPYHDWNDRITAECYAPNGASRIQNLENEIVRIVNNYARMSFNFGPTLLSWLHEKAPRAYHMILEADKTSAARYGGHGSAVAQVYNHIIMPLASTRDAQTQIRWGIADFEHRFGRRPEGMWLAETACNRQVLDLMAAEGIKYTILAPVQCARVRKLTNGDAQTSWSATANATVDPTQPYLVKLDGGRSIAVFFYDGPGSRAIAFEGLLDSGEKFASRLMRVFDTPSTSGHPAQLSHVATDGESYGHHHKHGEMALSFAMHTIEEQGLATLTNYGEFLARFPPTSEAEVAEDTSWSCSHGVRALALRLRLQRWQAGLEPALAQAAAGRARLPARWHGAAC